VAGERLAVGEGRLGGPAPEAGDGPVTATAALHLRLTALTDAPVAQVLFDPSRSVYAFERYLLPAADDRFGSAVARLRLDGRHLGGDLAWTLAADTGELRRRRDQALVRLCAGEASPSGLTATCPATAATLEVEGTGSGEAVLLSNGRPLGDEAQATWLLREAAVRWRFGRAGFATLRAGLARLTVADGLVHDDVATGLDLALDLGALGPPVALRLAAVQPTRDLPWRQPLSPLVLVEADWQVSLFERVGLFAAARRDRAGGVAQLFQGARLESAVLGLADRTPGTIGYRAQSLYLTRVLLKPPTSDATLAWAGLSGALVPFRNHRLTFAGVVSWGTIHSLDAASGDTVLEEVPLSGQAAQVRWAWSPADWLAVTPWFLYLSGDRSPYEKRRLALDGGYAGFLGVTPFVTATNLFFQGGVSEAYSSRQVSAPGVNGRGVVAPGLTVEVGLPGGVDLTARGAWLEAAVAGPFGGRRYGTEVDLELAWQPAGWLTVALEGDVLLPGDFFAGARPISKVVLALDLEGP